MEVATLAVAGCATALPTGLGAIPVWLLGARAEQLRPALWGLTVGLMGVASLAGLLLPALDEGSPVAVAAGLATGVAFLLVSRSALKRRDVHVGELSGAGVQRSVRVFAVLLVHSLPDGHGDSHGGCGLQSPAAVLGGGAEQRTPPIGALIAYGLLGHIADQVKDQVKETGGEALERGKQVAQDAAQSAKETAQESGQEQAEELKPSAADSAQETRSSV